MFRARHASCLVPLLLILALGCERASVPAARDARPANTNVVSDETPKSAAVKSKSTTAVVLTPPGKPAVTVHAELARTRAQRTRGLMYRQHLPEFAGMLFLFDEDEVMSFWMRNTLISLDLIFISADMKVVGIAERAKPLTLDSQTIGKPSRYVLEVNAGFSKAHGLAAGTKVSFQVPKL